jgi:hypothetical protein
VVVRDRLGQHPGGDQLAAPGHFALTVPGQPV